MNLPCPPALTARQQRADAVAHNALIGLFFSFPIAISVSNILMAVFLLAWLVGGRYRQRWNAIAQHALTWPSLLLYALVVLGLLYTPAALSETVPHLSKYFKLIIGLGMLSLLVDNPKLRQRCRQAFVLAMLITLALTYLNIWFDPPWSKTQNQGLGQDHTVFKDYISQGIMLSMLTVLCLTRALTSTTRWHKMVCVATALLAMFAITHLSAGRTGYLALFAALFLFSTIATPTKGRLWVIGAAVVGLSALVALSPLAQQRIHSAVTEALNARIERIDTTPPVTSTGARLAMIELSRQAIMDKPWLGTGTGSYQTLAKSTFSDPSWCAVVCVHPHNQFLLLGVEQGLLGIALFIWYLWRLARRGLAYPRPYNAAVLGFLGIFIVDSMVHGGLWLSTESHFLVFMSILLLSPPLSEQNTS